MSAQIIALPTAARRSALPADPAMRQLYWSALAWCQADRAAEEEAKLARVREALASAKPAPTPGLAEILKLLRRIDRRLQTLKTGISPETALRRMTTET